MNEGEGSLGSSRRKQGVSGGNLEGGENPKILNRRHDRGRREKRARERDGGGR